MKWREYIVIKSGDRSSQHRQLLATPTENWVGTGRSELHASVTSHMCDLQAIHTYKNRTDKKSAGARTKKVDGPKSWKNARSFII